MPKLELSQDELNIVVTCIDTSIESARRSQAKGKLPQLKEVYQQHERTLQSLRDKIFTTK